MTATVNAPAPPTTLAVDPAGIPDELGTRPQWVGWYWRHGPEREAKPWAKVPVNPTTGRHASSTDPATWGTMPAALAALRATPAGSPDAVQRRGIAGVGYVFAADDPYVGVDLDGAIDPATGDLAPWAAEIVAALDTYTERSPSGTGLHLIARGTLPSGNKRGTVEAYDHSRYFTVTGHALAGHQTIRDRPTELAAFHARTFGPQPGAAGDPTRSNGHRAGGGAVLSDPELIAKAMGAKNGAKFGRLYAGDAGGHPSASEADLALCSLVAFYSQDPAQVDRIFRGSGLMRAKWDERHHGDGSTYGEATVRRAIHERGDRWTPAGQSAPDGAAPDEPDADAGRDLPRIDAGDQHLPRVAAAAWGALTLANEPPYLFRFGGLPSRVERDGDDGAPLTRTVTEDRMRHELARAADWYKTSEKGGSVAAAPPVAVVRDMLAAPSFPFPSLAGIIEAPAFAADGTLPAGPGYHAAGRTFYAPAAGFVVPPTPTDPTPVHIAAARELLVAELLGDFPFTGDAERAHAVALLLLPFVRGLIAGPTPLHLIEKPTAGTGASLLADVLTRLATGHPVGAMTEGRDEDEWRKRLTAKLRGAASVVLIDNLRRRLDSANLATALTATYWEDRQLGTSDNLRLPVRAVWVATGNNPALSSEITRRTVRIRLDAKRDRPWLRAGFRHPDLGPWVGHERPALVGACLTLGRAWLTAGRPVPAGLTALGSFEEWSRVLGGILEVAGVPGFLGNLAEFYEQTDTEGAAVRGFLRAWWEAHAGVAVKASDLFTIADAPDSGLDLGDKGEQSRKIRLGNRLKELRDRHYQLTDRLTVRIVDAGSAQRAQLWRLVATDNDPNEASECGESSESFSKHPYEGKKLSYRDTVENTHNTHHTHSGGGPAEMPPDHLDRWRST